MHRKEICQILNCSESYVSHVLKGKHQSARAKKVRRLADLNFSLEEIFLDCRFSEVCDIVIKKAIQKQYLTVAHAVNCLRIRKYLLQRNAEKEGRMIQDDNTNSELLVNILEEGSDTLEKHFLSDLFIDMCETVLAKAKDPNLKKFAGEQMYLSLQLRSAKI